MISPLPPPPPAASSPADEQKKSVDDARAKVRAELEKLRAARRKGRKTKAPMTQAMVRIRDLAKTQLERSAVTESDLAELEDL